MLYETLSEQISSRKEKVQMESRDGETEERVGPEREAERETEREPEAEAEEDNDYDKMDLDW